MGKSRIYSRLTKTASFQGYGGRIVDYPLRAADAAPWAHSILPPAAVATVNWHLGQWSAPLPERISEGAAHEFSRGVMPEPPTSAWVTPDLDHLGHAFVAHMAATLECSVSDLVQVPKPSLVLMPAQWAVDHLASSATSIALVANVGGRRESGPVVWTSPMGEFYALSGSSLDREAVADLMDSAASAHTELLVLTSSDRLDLNAPQHLLDRDLLELFINARHVVLGAYDGEGYLRWSLKSAG